jgi:hypothetical protein
LNISSAPTITDASSHLYGCGVFVVHSNQNVGGTALNASDAQGEIVGNDSNVYFLSGATNWLVFSAHEFDTSIPTGTSAVIHNDLNIVLTNTHKIRGTLEDAGIKMANQLNTTQTWLNGWENGSLTSVWPYGSDSTLIKATRQLLPTAASQPVLDTGLDLSDVAFTSYLLRGPYSSTDNNGNTYATSLTTTANVTAQTASVASLSLNAFGGLTGGAYPSAPTITIAAPVSGVQATATPASYTYAIANGLPVFGVVANGTSGCANGETLTASGGTFTSAATFTTIASGGVITGFSAATPGTNYTVLPASPVTLTGSGTCSGSVTITGYWSIATTTVSAAGSGYPASPAPVVQTSGWNDSRVIPASISATMSTAAASLVLQSSGSKGVQVGAPSGGDKGAGTVNATEFYRAGTALATTFAPLASPTFTGIVTTPQEVISAGTSLSLASWTTDGVISKITSATVNDSTASGTVANETFNGIAAPTLTTTNGSVTVTNLSNLFVVQPAACTGNVTCTNRYAIQTSGPMLVGGGALNANTGASLFGAAVSINTSSNFNTNLNTGTSSGTITIGNSGNTGKVVLPGLTTGTNADTVCMSAGNVLLIQAAACTISSMRFKNMIAPVGSRELLNKVMHLNPWSFTMKGQEHNRDANARRVQIGITAENVAAVDPRMAVYEPDGATPKSYRQEAVIAALIGAVQEQQHEIDGLKRALHHRAAQHH